MAEQLHFADKEFSPFQEIATSFDPIRDMGRLVHGFPGDLEPISNTVPLTMGRKSAAGSVIGGIAETKVLLDFYGRHGITSDIEVIKIQDINEALERILNKGTAYEQKSVGIVSKPEKRG